MAAWDLPPLPDWFDRSNLPELKKGGIPDAPKYMVDNTGNTFGVAPDKGSLYKPITDDEALPPSNHSGSVASRANVKRGYWAGDVTHGVMPHAPDGYQMFRNVLDFGAVGDGVTDDTAAINRAASWMSVSNSEERCGVECGQTTRLGAIVYFPSGNYLISSPIIQYYFTQFIGDANDRPTIIGSEDFTGIALVDCDPYIPEGDGANWYINQNQFFRQIKHIKFNLERMPLSNTEHDQEYAPTGIHWQVSQAASLQNLDFRMPLPDSTGAVTAVGIFMENGSGGFLSDLTFFGGMIGFRAGSQQYTARNLHFQLTNTAISMIWDWGFTWQNIVVENAWVAIACREMGGEHGQGTGSLTILDSIFRNVPYPIVLRNGGPYPALLLENVQIENCASVVLVDGGETLLAGSSGSMTIPAWGMGKRYAKIDEPGEYVTGYLDSGLKRPASLVDSAGAFFARSKPTYSSGGFIVATDHGISNKNNGDQADAINKLLAENIGTPVFFPSGIYLVAKTVFVPVGSIIVGELWPQIMGYGDYFSNEDSPQVMVRVGNKGDSGVVEISDMLWSVKGATAGAIMMEWNVRESIQGSAAMWDSHFRVGGAFGTELTRAECPKGSSVNRDCMAAFLLFHVTTEASGYFENVWVWTADHDMDVAVPGGVETTTDAQINIFTGRGVLIESQGPCWFYGSGSEHHQLYQYQLSGAKDIFMTHIQTESPYYQPAPDALAPYKAGALPNDPLFEECDQGTTCADAWAIRVLNSRDVLIYTAGLYSWFNEYAQDCLVPEDCQERVVETSYTSGFWMYNIFSKGVVEIFTPRGGIKAILQSDDNQYGYTTEVNAWHGLAFEGGDRGGAGGKGDVVYIDPIVYSSHSVECLAPCTFVMPTSKLPETTTISIPPYTTSLVVGTTTTTVTFTLPAITTTAFEFSNVHATDMDEVTEGAVFTADISIDVGPVYATLTVSGTTTTRRLTLPPWPQITQGPPESWTSFYHPWIEVTDNSTSVNSTTWDGGGFTPGFHPSPITTTTTSTEIVPPPIWTKWPPGVIENDDDDDDDDDDEAIIVPCAGLWFFSFCIDFPGLKLKTWKITIPEGRIGPGPPPPGIIDLPGWRVHFKGPLPPWPKVTRGPGPKPVLEYPEKPENCATVTQEVEFKTLSEGLSVTDGQTITTTVSTITHTGYVLGCEVPDYTPTISSCEKPTAAVARAVAEPTGPIVRRQTGDDSMDIDDPMDMDLPSSWNDDMQCEGGEAYYILYPREHKDADVALIVQRLAAAKAKNVGTFDFIQVRGSGIDFTAFFVLKDFPEAMVTRMREMSSVRFIYQYWEYVRTAKIKPEVQPWGVISNRQAIVESAQKQNPNASEFEKRAYAKRGNSKIWPLSQMCAPEGTDWLHDSNYATGDSTNPTFTYHYDDSAGSGQRIYIIEDEFPNYPHPEFDGMKVDDVLSIPSYGYVSKPSPDHGASVVAAAAGQNLGVAPGATIVPVRLGGILINEQPIERILHALVLIANDVKSKNAQGKAVINMSYGTRVEAAAPIKPWKDVLLALLEILQNDLDVVLVTASGNDGESESENLRSERWYPQALAFRRDLADLIVVGSVDVNARRPWTSNRFSGHDPALIYAWGHDVYVPISSGGYGSASGTSFAAPMVAGLVAYIRALPITHGKWDFKNHAVVKDVIERLSRKLTIQVPNVESDDLAPPVVWNGQILDVNCFLQSAKGCPEWLSPGSGSGDGSGGSGNGDNGNGPDGQFTYHSGAPDPTCKGIDCGKLCKGYYCEPTPSGFPPDFSTIPSPILILRGHLHSAHTANHLPADPGPSTKTTVATTRVTNPGTTTKDTSTRVTTNEPVPTLPPAESECASTATASTTTQCIGSGGRESCVTTTVCVDKPPPSGGPRPGGPTNPNTPNLNFVYARKDWASSPGIGGGADFGHTSGFTITDTEGNELWHEEYPGGASPCANPLMELRFTSSCWDGQWVFKCSSDNFARYQSCSAGVDGGVVEWPGAVDKSIHYAGISITVSGTCGGSFSTNSVCGKGDTFKLESHKP
ncbi:Glucan 1,3-beta-glucosidase [Paramyrothecium foliicola]|nr:Glucan 1,3-beta-glucosidase [Paramyrothecium foliicola]